ncbi:T9SS type A sorting domain-containing protein [Polaribacter sp. Asnod6-C07]|uniref:T9SS type A sorting domain-containing protein n=1 Tax=Polaribacter sp. Asnod6-C07 TaxID=3160582 RepID=UPI003863E497
MKHLYLLFLFVFCFSSPTFSQVTLTADGSGNTYELINSVLAPNYDVVEVPDCKHTTFGRHIDELFDADLNKNVFRFFAHANEDDDRCKNDDRQRTEIKSYDKSPENLKAIEGEKVVYKWKMKIDANFQASPNFTHLHQLKSVGGDFSSIPMYTLTARKGTPDQLELRQTSTDDQETLKKVDLSLIKGHWVEFTERIEFGTNSYYSIEIKRVDNQTIVFEYENNSIDNWQNGAEFVRPKWGIYRSLNNVQDLRDEAVLFADFSIEEVNTLSVNDLKTNNQIIKIFPNPVVNEIQIINYFPEDYSQIYIYNVLGKLIDIKQKNSSNTHNISHLKSGTYFLIFKNDEKIISRNTVVIQ